MKILFSTLIFLSITLTGYGQFSRSFFLTTNNYYRVSSIVKQVNELKYVSIHESGNDTLRVSLVTLDDEGETSNYQTIEYTPFTNFTSFQISGAGVNTNGDIVLCILIGAPWPDMKVRYYTLNTTSNSVTQVSELPNLFSSAYVRSRIKQDSIVTYLSPTIAPTSLERISTSLSNTNSTSIELVSDSLTYNNYNISSAIRKLELFIDENDEYIAFKNYGIKRSGVNLYQPHEFQVFNNYQPLIIKNEQSVAFVFGQEIFVLDSQFAQTNQYSLNNPNFTFHPIEGYSTPTGYRFWGPQVSISPSQKINMINCDSSFNTVEYARFADFKPNYHTIINKKNYILGRRLEVYPGTSVDGIAFPNNGNLHSLVSDDVNKPLKPFIEYNQLLENGKIEFKTNHVGESFSDGLYLGFRYKLNGKYRNLVHTSSQYTIGHTMLGDTVGFMPKYQNQFINPSNPDIVNRGTFVVGPFTSPGQYSHEIEDKYNRGYYVSREMIDLHINAIQTNDTNYIMPFGIKHWPTNGDITKGQADKLAGYVDANLNGEYDPENGDYPSIYGDQCLLNIYHHHPLSYKSSGIETHQYYFTFDCPKREELESAVFVRLHEFSRMMPLTNVYHATKLDFNIGNRADDYAGTNVELGMIYGINGDPFDNINGALNFNDTLPAFGALMLQGMKLTDNGLDRPLGFNPGESLNGIGFGDGIPGNEYYTLESSYFNSSVMPNGPYDVKSTYNTMLGRNPDGSFQSDNNVIVRHSYFGTSDPQFYSSNGADHGNNHNEADDWNIPNDRVIYGASGPTDILVGDTNVLINAYIVGIDTVNISGDSSLAILFRYGQQIKDMFAANSTPCGSTFDSYVYDPFASTLEHTLSPITLYPNPANQTIHFQGIQSTASVRILDLNGREVLTKVGIKNDTDVNISQLRNAVYFVSVTDDDGTRVIRMVKL